MRSILKASTAIIVAAAMMASSVAPASADHWDRGGGVAAGVGLGILGLGILGAAERDRYYHEGRYCHPGPLECRTFERPCFHNEYGDSICPAPERRCFRREYCD